jgi:hypothetical protein
MRSHNHVAHLDSLFNRIQRVRDKRVASRLSDPAFVRRHFPYHEVVARRETAGLAAMQARLMAEYQA